MLGGNIPITSQTGGYLLSPSSSVTGKKEINNSGDNTLNPETLNRHLDATYDLYQKGNNFSPVTNQGTLTDTAAPGSKKSSGEENYNILTLPSGRRLEVNIDDSIYGEFTGITEEQKETGKKQLIEANRERLTGLLASLDDKLPEGLTGINITTADARQTCRMAGEEPVHYDMNYDREKKTLSIPFDRVGAQKEQVEKELADATNPALNEQKKKLQALGIRWVDSHNLLTADEEIRIMQNLERTASRVMPEKRPKNLTVAVTDRDRPIMIQLGMMGLGGSGPSLLGGDALGIYHNQSDCIEIFKYEPDGKEIPLEKMGRTAVHEYGHAVSDTNEQVEDPLAPMVDSKGKSITKRAKELEEKATGEGHRPGNPEEDNPLYDRYDPYVESHPLLDSEGKVAVKKYARENKNEHYAETFQEYVSNPSRFRSKMQEMEETLSNTAKNTPEYEYLRESLDIMKESYNYFKNNIFGGYEF